MLTEEQSLDAMLLLEPLLSVDVPLISVYLLQGELLLPAGEELIFLLLPGVDVQFG